MDIESPKPAQASKQLLDEVRVAMERGNILEAIKLLRGATGMSLKDAKAAIERGKAGGASQVPAIEAARALPASVVGAVRKGNKPEAIRLLRDASGLGLKEANDAVERFAKEHPTAAHGLSPGEVPPTSGGAWLLVVAGIAALIVYYLLRG